MADRRGGRSVRRGADGGSIAGAAIIHASVVVAFVVGCRTVPPELPELPEPTELPSGAAPELSGWPPPRVFADEPLHPANRWFHRSFARRDEAGVIVAVDAAAPASELLEPSAIDKAEIAAILRAVAHETSTCSQDSTARLVLRADLVAQARFWRRRGDDTLAMRHEEIAREFDDRLPPGRVGALDALGSGDWREVDQGASAREHLIDAGARSSRVFEDVGDAAATSVAIVSFTELGSGVAVARECAIRSAAGGRVAYALRRLDRAALLAGGERWRSIARDERIAFRGHDDALAAAESSVDAPVAALHVGTLEGVCARCHAQDEAARPRN